jgi:hypothetical protein
MCIYIYQFYLRNNDRRDTPNTPYGDENGNFKRYSTAQEDKENHLHRYIYVYLFMYIDIYICIHTNMYIHIYVFIHIHVYSYKYRREDSYSDNLAPKSIKKRQHQSDYDDNVDRKRVHTGLSSVLKGARTLIVTHNDDSRKRHIEDIGGYSDAIICTEVRLVCLYMYK